MIRALVLVLCAGPAAPCPVLGPFANGAGLAQVDGVPVQCSTSRVLGGGGSEDCFWTFELRSAEARALFAALEAELATCATAVTRAPTDVNHPDSFDQLTGIIDGVPVSLSLKDKGALAQTLVFVRRALP